MLILKLLRYKVFNLQVLMASEFPCWKYVLPRQMLNLPPSFSSSCPKSSEDLHGKKFGAGEVQQD
jgi:hypothetical protein